MEEELCRAVTVSQLPAVPAVVFCICSRGAAAVAAVTSPLVLLLELRVLWGRAAAVKPSAAALLLLQQHQE